MHIYCLQFANRIELFADFVDMLTYWNKVGPFQGALMLLPNGTQFNTATHATFLN